MSTGWVKLHRKILDNPIFKNDKLFRVFMYLLLKASHTERDQLIGDSIVHLETGQWATGRKAISRDTGLTEQNVRTAISKLEKLGILTIKVTVKYSIFSITNWHNHQQDNQQVTNKQPTSNQQVTTNKNVKNVKNVNNKDLSVITDGFDHWWNLYPSCRRKNKAGCLTKFKAKCKNLTDDQVEELVNIISLDIQKRISEADELKFIPMTEPYLNQQRWEDGQ
jgi:hypothetical protein